MNESNRLAELRERYAEALVGGEDALARLLIERAVGRGVGHVEIYLDVLAPAQVRIGELWHEGRVNTAQEHLATTITLGVMDDLRQGMKTPTGLGVRAVVTPVEGDQHSIGARMIADLLAMDGWEVDFLGTGTPASDLGEFVSHRNVDLVAISSTMPEFLPNVRAATDVIRGGASPIPRIILGGGALGSASPDLETLGCDVAVGSALEAVSEARRLVGLTENNLTLGEHLSLMGRRINAERTSRGMTQQKLADASGLDRTYISLVEHGRQNLSIGAVLKIANALEVPMGDLLALPTPGSQFRHK